MVWLLSSMFSYATHFARKVTGNLIVEDVIITRSGVGESSWRPQCDQIALVKRATGQPRCALFWDGATHDILCAQFEGEEIFYIDLC